MSGFAMKKSKYSNSEIINILDQAETGVSVPEPCRSTAWATQRFTSGEQNTAAWMSPWSRAWKSLKTKTVAWKKCMLKIAKIWNHSESVEKKRWSHLNVREMAQACVLLHTVSIRLDCLRFCVSESCYRYQPKLSDENDIIADWLIRLTTARRNWDFGLCVLYLQNVKGFTWNHKRFYRHILWIRIKPKN